MPSTAIIPAPMKPNDWRETYLTAMFLLFARAQRKAESEVDGFFCLGEIGEVPEKEWTRLTPYSIARKEHGGDGQFIDV